MAYPGPSGGVAPQPPLLGNSPPADPTPTTPGTPGAGNGQTTVYTANQSGSGTQTGTGVSQAASQFTPEQQALQGQVGNLYNSFLSGQTGAPAYFTAPPQVFDAYNAAFQKNVAPGIAAQYGAGSPQLGAQQSYGNQQLAANLYQSGIGNYMNALGAAGGFAMNPIGQNANNAYQSAGTKQGATTGVESNSLTGSLLALLLGLAKGSV